MARLSNKESAKRYMFVLTLTRTTIHIVFRFGEYIPLQRWGEKADIANATVFLFSEAANFISGHILVIDGGECHTRTFSHPYPDSVLNPKSKL